MRFQELGIQTKRQAPSNARTEGFALLVRAGYLTRENALTRFGEYTVNHLSSLQAKLGDSFFKIIGLDVIGNDSETFFPIKSGSMEVAHCPSCKYTERIELARFAKPVGTESISPLPPEKVSTPDCNTIELLANFLGIPKEKTAKALMFTRLSDGKFVFVVVRGDMQLSEGKLKKIIGVVRPATAEEIAKAGAAAGYASPIGLKNAMVVADDLIPESINLVAGANESGYHFKNINYGRDYSAEIIVDLVQAKEGDACPNCGKPLSVLTAELLFDRNQFYFENILLALAETYHDEKGLTLSKSASPFSV
ncbi:MAG TPA: YbaK/EbsC family protein, partial [Anaerolineales bacterium]|nr:YbaK/EbsC family protein [Anaerolineales bacterium]